MPVLWVHWSTLTVWYDFVRRQRTYLDGGLVLGSSLKKYTSGHVMPQSCNCAARLYDYVTRLYNCCSCTNVTWYRSLDQNGKTLFENCDDFFKLRLIFILFFTVVSK